MRGGTGMIISNQQLVIVEATMEWQFASALLGHLCSLEIINPTNRYALDDVNRLLMDGRGAGIRTKNHIYRLAELAFTHQVLLNKPFPDWGKNILYANALEEDKIKALESFLEAIDVKSKYS